MKKQVESREVRELARRAKVGREANASNGSGVWGLGFRVMREANASNGFGVWGLGFRVRREATAS